MFSLLNSNEHGTKILTYIEENHVFKPLSEFNSEFVVHHRRRGVQNASFSAINNSYCVCSFNISFKNQGDSLFLTTLVIFDLKAGKIVHRLTQENTFINMTTNTLCLAQHPTMEKICVTSDFEGQIIFWDCCTGTAVRIFNEHAGLIGKPLEYNSVFDCNFSKCGNFLVCGTNYGSFSLYGYGAPDFYDHVDSEQFTNTDYVNFSVLPDSFQIINNDTGLPFDHEELTLEQKNANFCNLNLTAITRMPTNVTFNFGRIFIEEKANVLKMKLAEIKKVEDQNQKDFQETIRAERARAEKFKRDFRNELTSINEKKNDTSSKPQEPNLVPNPLTRPQTQLLGPPSTALLHHPQIIDAPENSDEELGGGFRRLRRARASESSVSERDFEGNEADDEFDEENFEDEMPRRRSSRLNRRNTGGANLLQQRHRNRRTGMTLRSDRHQEDQMLGKRDTKEESEADSEEFYQGLNRRKVEAREKTRAAETIEEELFCTRCNQVGAREQCEGKNGSCPSVFHKHCSDLCGTDLRDRFLCFYCLLDHYDGHPTSFEYSKKELDDAWLDIQFNDTDFLTPQVGDIYYFAFQPYEMFVSKLFDLLNFNKGDEFWPWKSRPYFQEREIKCEIVKIEYEFPKIRGKKMLNDMKKFLTIIMKITLRILDTQHENQMMDEEAEKSNTFQISYFPVTDVPSFLIWHRVYEKRVRDFRIAPSYSELKFDNFYYNLKEKSPSEESFPTTLFHCIKARAILEGISTRRREQNTPDGEVCFSPWEVDFPNIQNVKPKKFGIMQEEPFGGANQPEEPLLPEDPIPSSVKEKVRYFMKNYARYCPAFIREVDKKMYPDYMEAIKVEMYLMKIHIRLREKYYRSLKSLSHDIDLILENARIYNNAGSIIVQQAVLIVDYLKQVCGLSEEKERDNPQSNLRSRDVDRLIKQLKAFNLADDSFNFEAEEAEILSNLRSEVQSKRSVHKEPVVKEQHLPPPQAPTPLISAYASRLRRTPAASNSGFNIRIPVETHQVQPPSNERFKRRPVVQPEPIQYHDQEDYEEFEDQNLRKRMKIPSRAERLARRLNKDDSPSPPRFARKGGK